MELSFRYCRFFDCRLPEMRKREGKGGTFFGGMVLIEDDDFASRKESTRRGKSV